MKINSNLKWFWILGLTVPAIVIGYIVYGFVGRSRLIKNHSVVTGHVYGCWKGVKGSPKACNVRYRYTVDGTSFNGVTLFGPAQLTYEDCQAYIVKHNFPVVYENGNPDNSLLLLTPGACRIYHYNFPDSLKWAQQYAHE
jgi:hypothetical protein